jgi:predicted Zn-dependent peptidase
MPRALFLRKDTEQYHLTLGAPGLARDDERRFALRVLDNILGGTSSSRLFQEVREHRGLAYSVFSFQSLFAETGLIGLYLGTRPDNVAPALQVVADELARLRADGVTADELERSKENVKGRMVLSLESTAARMNRLGAAVLNDLPLLSVDEVVKRIEAVTIDDLAELTSELLAPERLSVAGIGTDEDVFRRGIEPVVPALAAVPAAKS